MKRLKYIFSALLLLLVVVGITTSCEDAGVDENSSINMSNEFSTLVFGGDITAEGEEKMVIITTSAAWSISTPDEWVHLSIESGSAGKSSFYVSVDANYTNSTRYGTIEIVSGMARKTIIVEQSHYQYIDVPSNSYSYDGRNNTFYIVVSTNIAAKNIDVSLSSESAEWISYSSPVQTTISSEEIQLKYTFEVAALGDEEERSADVVISYSKIGVGQTINISQSAYPTLLIEADELAQEFDYYERECTVNVTSNVDVVVEIPEGYDWLTLNEDSDDDGSNKNYTFALLDNSDTTVNRDCDVKFAYYAKNNSTNISEEVVELTKVVNIKQLGKVVDVSYVDESQYTDTQNYILNKKFEVALRSNVPLTATIVGANSWVTLVGEPTTEDVDSDANNGDDMIYTFTFELAQNESDTTIRTESVNFTNTLDDTKNLNLVITQDKMPSTFTVANTTTGELATAIANTNTGSLDLTTISRVVISGEALDSADFTALKTSFTNVAYIDISATATTAIPDSQFSSFTSLKQILLPSTLVSIGASAFKGSGLESITIPASVMTWGVDASGYNDAFMNTPITSVVLPEGLKTVGCRAFYNISITSLYIPSTITSWQVNTITRDGSSAIAATSQAFNNCSNLNYVELANGLATLPAGIFANSSYLDENAPFTLVSHSASAPTIVNPTMVITTGADTYYIISSATKALTYSLIYVPAGCSTNYATATGWLSQKNIIEM